ncbi:DUF4374 domain-containing protein [Dyadobacter psychrotolerans]|uniref:DUF4374 domain-containing protein n=1 Tax=Dyadobacter psychrotolerans TaxID=2541721 RepID=A0A4V2Z3X9_9BACT|nr:DUF4374 domain-containing protein [Dyadobacter psychrotolerans]TDE14448.1 DUF4374 domain-containing protein [Dyadobacter psychrotolerans]
MKVKKSATAVIFVSVLSCFLVNCRSTDDTRENDSEKAHVFVLTGSSEDSQNTYILPYANLMTDSTGSERQQINISKKWANEQWIIQSGSTFFNIDPDQNKLLKLEFSQNKLNRTGEIPFSLFKRINWYQWLGGDTLLIGGNGPENTTQDYALIDTGKMSMIRSGVFDVPAPPENRQVYSCSGIIRDGKFYLGYSIIDPEGSGNGQYANDTAYLASMDYPSFSNVKLSKDSRSTFPGGGRAGNGTYFVENGDIYILTSPVDWNGFNYNKPTGFFRIKKGEDTFDKNYFFNVSALLNGDDPDALIYLGNGKAIVRNARHKDVKQWSDWSKEITQYVVLDVNRQTAKILDLPPFVISPGGYAENGKAFLPVQTEAAGTRIYEYDAATDELTKGIQIKGIQKFGKIYKVR